MQANSSLNRTVSGAVLRRRRHGRLALLLALMRIANAESFEPLLRELLDRHSTEPVALIFVDDVAEWCANRHGQCAGNPIAMAIREVPSNQAGILMRRKIDATSIRGVKDRMFACGLDSLAARLDGPSAFMSHLVLHELAHLTKGWGQAQECDCDKWAFRAMGLA